MEKVMDESYDEKCMLHGQALVWKYMLHFIDSMALKAAVDLRIPDIIHSHAAADPITLSQIAAAIDSPSPDTTTLSRILRLLVRRKIFTSAVRPSDGATVYGQTPASRWLLRDTAELSMAPMLLFQTHPLSMAPFHCFSRCVREGGFAFQKAHGKGIFEMAAGDAEFNKMFNDGMQSMTEIISKAIVSGYGGDGFGSVGSLVDVGGGTGAAVAEIVKAFPHIKGINFDLPHVVATAPDYQGVSHVGGDMFVSIPPAQAIFIKWVLHDWGDEECVKILKNCREALPEKTGKLIIVDAVLNPEAGGDPIFGDISYVTDLLMVAHSTGGKERTEEEWKRLLMEAGFPNYNIIPNIAVASIIEAYSQ
nr:O-methyltransferase OMT2 [Ipomoea batatas]